MTKGWLGGTGSALGAEKWSRKYFKFSSLLVAPVGSFGGGNHGTAEEVDVSVSVSSSGFGLETGEGISGSEESTIRPAIKSSDDEIERVGQLNRKDVI